MKKLLIFLFPLLIQMGCSNKVHEQPSNKYPFELKMKALFSDNLEMVNSLRKAEVQISSFDLPQETNQIDKVISLLKKDGWILKGKGRGVDTYCLGKNNRINIVIPTSGELYDFKGGKLKRTDYSVNAVLYSYDKWGDDMCE
ncbi:hypothetical protein ACJBLD_14270 [Acinetobacter nosocomialis]|uniref:hypothetical protein n=2 Tax=Acinetobacter nosocomialis TaxID=106654 RepID=UPI000D0BD4E1|nr:hypothetical protein [Acinetobacter nosocomialis]MDC9816240.1 hypothetical protein [Acinetobacter nosocomialis]MDE9405199.1 hypothetical protein [Acinetobacter nosocomialis]PSE45711.1 hypothetical protein C7G97_02545 [Acinetobacter nosocomialis]PSE82710.1 hypothetical protein C7G91_10535 [Acinetobacter nosocomialis]HDG7213218.1 hypothetical protein [Acinetobacter nosocomialis]